MTDSSWTSLTSPEAMLKGFISGFLFAGGLFNPSFGPAIQVMLVILGIAGLLDAIIPSSRSMHGFTVFVFALAGGIMMLALSISGNSPAFLLVAVLIAVLLHLKNILTGLHVLSK